MAAKKAKKSRKSKSSRTTAPEPKPEIETPHQPEDAEVVVIRDRVKELRRVKASELIPDPENWRTHPRAQKRAVSAVLSEIGYADAVLAYETPQGLKLVDGHLRRELTPDQVIPVLILDITEQEAHTILLTLDPLAGMAGMDKVHMESLLKEVDVKSAALQDMLAKMASQAGIALEDDEEEPDTGKQNTGQYNVLVVCEDESQQLELIERFIAEGLECRGLIS